MTEPEEITSLKGHSIPRKISVDYISFSAHVDYSQNSEFIEQVRAQHVVSDSLSHLSHRTVITMLLCRSLSMVNRLQWAVCVPP